MDPKMFVLKPNSAMLDPNFSGYKLNLDKIATHSKKINNGVLQAAEAPGSYSYQQVRLHALHNHLWQDPWEPHRCFFFSADGALNQITLDQSALSSPLQWSVVLRLPLPATEVAPPSAVHPSLSLTSEQMALVSDGRGRLHVVETGDRSSAQLWTVRFSDTLLEGSGFVLTHSLLDASGRLHLLTSQVAEVASVLEWRPQGEQAGFLHLLAWLQFCKGESGWRLGRMRQAATAGTVHYACLERDGAALCVAADRAVRVVRDSERAAEAPSAVAAAGAGGDTGGGTAEASSAQPLYVWTQTGDDVTAQLTVAAAAKPQVVLEARSLTVSLEGSPLLRGTLPAAIRLDESTWTNDQGRLEVVLVKAESGPMWNELLEGDSRGQQVSDPELAAAAADRLSALAAATQGTDGEERSAYNATELDTCDDFPDDGTALVRIDGETHAVTHQADLSSHQYILTACLGAAEQPALCVRHDVDALLWQPRFQDGRWECEHVGTLQAFGFVQASKTQRKFMACAPDKSYAVICDASRHLFIYHQPSPVEGDLRNRRTGQRVAQVSRQQVVSLEDTEPILGVAAAVGCLYVLTGRQLHALLLS